MIRLPDSSCTLGWCARFFWVCCRVLFQLRGVKGIQLKGCREVVVRGAEE
jgi:hypothetical protein